MVRMRLPVLKMVRQKIRYKPSTLESCCNFHYFQDAIMESESSRSVEEDKDMVKCDKLYSIAIGISRIVTRHH